MSIFFLFFGSKVKLAVVSWKKLAKIMKPSRFGREKIETDGRGDVNIYSEFLASKVKLADGFMS